MLQVKKGEPKLELVNPLGLVKIVTGGSIRPNGIDKAARVDQTAQFDLSGHGYGCICRRMPA